LTFDPWTFLLQTINFLILVWLLRHFLYRPVKALIARRQKAIDSAFEKAKAREAAAEKTRADYTAKLEGIEAERTKRLHEADQTIETQRRAVLKAAEDEAGRRLAAAERTTEREREAATDALMNAAADMAVDLARRLLEMAAPGASDWPFVDAALQMFESDKSALALSPSQARIEVKTARALGRDEQATCRARLQALIGGAEITFTTDSALIAGVEIDLPGRTISLNWRDALGSGKALMVEHVNAH
jgi:F-type H+-transporting ATPase subunit b